MKRAGKLFLVVVLVLSMFWTSTGTSNALGVFAENSAASQSVEEDKEAKASAEGKDSDIENTGESTAASTTTQEASTEAKKKKEEVTTQEKKAESTTAVKKKTAKSKITTQDAAEAATKGSDSNSSNQNIARAAKIDIANCITAVDMSVTINGKKTALDDLPDGTLVPRGAPVSITVKYDNVDHALENLSEGTVLHYQLPEQIEIVAERQGDLTEEGKVVGKFTISENGLVEITFTEGYLTDCGGKIEQGSFWLNGSFNKEFGGKGQETIIFGPVKKTIHFDPKLEEDKTNLTATKVITGFDAKTQKLTYTITVTAPADNTQTVKDVKVTDVFADNSLKMLENLYKDIKASKGTFDAKTGIWTIGDMEKGEIQTLTYSVKVKNSWDDTITDKTISNTATVTAGTEKKAEVTSNKVFNNNLNITKSTVDGQYGTSKGIHVDATGTWIKYTITVNAANVNQDDASGVKVTDIFSDNKEDIEQYYAIEGAAQTNSTEPGAGEIYIDNNKKDFIWNIGTMKPGETKTLTYCVKLKDSVWENSGNTSDTVQKKFTNKATLTATGMEEDKSATTTVNLKKVWISKKGKWDASTGRMKFTVEANKRTDHKGNNINAPVLDRNFTFTDKMTDDYKYTGNLVIEAKNASGTTQWTDTISLEDSDEQTSNHGTFTWNTDGGWTYRVSQAGEYIYYLTYYAKPTKSVYNYVNNTASVGINGSNYAYKTNWSGTGSDEINLTKEYVSGVTTGKMKWKTTIPVRVVEGSAYVDTISSPRNHKFVSKDKLREGLDIYFGQESNKLEEGKDYTLTYNNDDAYTFTITFLREFDANTTNRIVITYYTENTVARDDAKYKEGDKFTHTNTGKLTIRDGQSLEASDSAVWYKHSSISKEAGDYDKKNHTIRWFITLNKDGTLGTPDGKNSVATVTDTLPEGLKYVTNGNTQNIQITEKGRQAAKAAIDSNSIKYDEASCKLTFNVTGLKSDSKNSNEGYVKIAIDTLVDDEYIGLYTEKTYENKAQVKYNNYTSPEAAATKTIKNTTLKKDSEYVKGSSATYTLTVNPDGENLLKDKDTITVVDQMPKIMTLLSDSITVNGKSLAQSGCTFTKGAGDADHNEYRFTVPDNKKILIQYEVTINAAEDTAVTLSNTAWYKGVENTAVNNSKEIIVLNSGAEITGPRSFSILKVESQTLKPIKGAEFTLEKARVENGKIIDFETVMNEGNKTKTTGEDGKIKFTGLNKDGLYRFTEVNAAPGYKNSGKTIYVAFTKAMQDFGAKAGYTVTGIAGGATIQVENMPTGSLTIEKKVIGNNIPEETYKMSVTANKGNTDTDLTKATVTTDNNAVITPAISTKDGQSTLTFSLKAGHKAKVSGLPVGTYNVTENAASRTETDKTAYTASYSVDGKSVSNVEVTVAQDADSSTVPNVTVTNTYKTELKVLKKDIGTDAPLLGAQLAIYNNSDVTFDSEGKATVKDGATAVASWTSGTDEKDLTGKVVAGGNYVLVETAVPTSDYVQAAAIPFKVDAEGRIQVADAYANNYNDSTHTITLSNQKKTGSLTVKKIIEDGEADTAFDFTVIFTNFNNGKGGDVTVTRKDKEGKDQTTTETVTPDAEGNLKLELKALTNNETVKISEIPYGTSYTVTETQKEGYLETANSNLTGVIGDNGTAANDTKPEVNAEASITNTRLTGFTVKKSVEYGQYTPDAETKDKKQFKFKVTLTRKEQPYTGKFKLQYSDDKNNNKGNATPEVNADSPGVYTIQLKDTQTATFSNLPSGTKYTVEEVADANYDASVKVNNTAQNVDSNNNADNNKNVAATAEGTIDKTGDTVVFTNTRKLGAFSFTKTVKGNTQDKEQAYGFYVEVDGKSFNGNAAITDGTTAKITDGKLSLKDGQTATIANIPAGVSYSIKETTGDRYVTLINNKVTAETTGTVEEGKTSETQFVNQVIHLNVTKTDLTRQKEVAGATMTLYKAEDVNEGGTVKDGAKALDSWVSGKESFHDFGPAVKAGESYVLVETAAPGGYAYAENISFTVNKDGTIKTNAEKTTDKETGEDIYLVKDDVTRVSIKKMDITGQKEVAGARLLLKDKDGNVIESWMSTTEAHVFERKLIAGETYTLTEVTAPGGYEVAADITFTVNKDGTVSVDGKAVNGNEIIMKDETTPAGEEGKLVVSKLVTFQGKNQAVNRTFYTALFSDAACTKKVSNVKELKCEGAWSAYTVFEHLKDGTYYVAETDAEGNKLESSEACKIEGNGRKCAITPTQKTAYAVIENQLLIPGDDFLNTLHKLTVTKNVTLDGNPISDKYNGTFYVSLFTDPYYTNRIDDVKALQIQNGKSTSVSFTDLADGTYYVAETDKDGNPVENTDFGFDVTYDGDIAVAFTEQNTDSTLGITNDMNERNPEYDKYLKEKDDNNGDDDKNKNNTSNHSSNKTTKKGKNSKTGDYSHILFYAALAAAALVVGSAEMYRRMHRAARRKNKHNR